MDIFKLVGSVFVDTSGAEESLKKTDEKAGGLGNTLLSAAGSAGKFAAGLATAAAGAVTGMVALASSTASTCDEIDKASQRMNIDAESYQELSHAAGLCGVSMSTMEQAAKKLVGTDISFDEAMDNIYALETAEERAAMAAELFGDKVAYEMTPMLNASGEEMAAMKEEAHELGAVMSNDMVADGATLNDTISKIKEGFGGIVNQLGGALMPIINKAGEYIISLMPTFNAIIEDIMPVLVDMLDALLPIFMDLVEQLLPPILEIVKALLPIFVEVCKVVLPILVSILKTIIDLVIKYILPAIQNFIAWLPVLWASIKQGAEDAKNVIINTWNNIKNVITTIKNVISNIVNSIKTVFTSAWNTISTATTNVFNKIKSTISSVMNAVINVVKTPLNAIIGLANKVIEALNKISVDIPSWVPVWGGKKFGFDLKKIPLLAKGGTVEEGGKAIVGEAGAELIDLPVGAKVKPLTKEDGLRTDEILESMADILAQMQTMQNALVNAIGKDMRAYITQKDVYNAVVDADREHYSMTHRPSFAG